MVRLLISVRNTIEAENALEGGADLIDIKEPDNGSLGAADVSIGPEIASVVAGRRPLSAALGELLDEEKGIPRAGLSFAKWGLGGCANRLDWPDLLRARASAARRQNPQCRPVGVAYADWGRAKAPPPLVVCRESSSIGCAVFLIDTFVKDGSSLVDWLALDQLSEFQEMCKKHAMGLALAGGIGFDSLETILKLQPDWIAVRGAACLDGRQGSVCPNRVRELARIVHAFPNLQGHAARFTVTS
jgi:hypothetical protein